jgi:phosphatidylserine/phosphatidylglycerophosphate/cardiolipin synthase-like enzyme
VTTVLVAFPVVRGTSRFFVQKGRRWSIIEHLLLDAASREPGSAADFASKSGLPRRVVVEAFIRLMRAGWVEISASQNNLVFRATALGMVQAPLDQLPAATVTQPRKRSYAIEQITGGVFRSRELDMRPSHRIPVAADDQLVVQLQRSFLPADGDLSEVFTAIEGEDELIVGVDRSDEKLIERQAVVTVREGVIDGLPARASLALRNLILGKAAQAAAAASPKRERMGPPLAAAESEASPTYSPEPTVSRPALYEHDDLIVDGAAHSTSLERTIRNASVRVIIHSTFVTDAGAQAILPLLLHASAKGVLIDVLWGQDDIGTATNSSQAAAQRLMARIAEAGRSDSIRVHPFSTNSHAKVVVADNGKGRWYALLGSCNWLASNFTSFEVSIRLRDPALVGQLICRLAGLTRGRPGIWHELAVEMTVLGRSVESGSRGNGRTVPMRLLFAPDHAKLTLEARDRAKKRIFVLSHRLGVAGRPVALLPILSAVKANNIEAVAYYGQTTGALSGTEGADLTREFVAQGVKVQPIHRPRLHAKALGWDDDALAITSLNWLSADPPDLAVYREIGVLVEAPRIADNFLRVFENARID